MRKIAIALGLCLMLAASGANAAGEITLSMEAQPFYDEGEQVVFAGRLAVAGLVPLGLHDVTLLVNGQPAVVAMTSITTGGYAARLTFPIAPQTHTVQAVAYRGTPLEARSQVHTITYRLGLASLTVSPPSRTIAPGATVAFTALGVHNDGSTSDQTNSVSWSSSNTAVATISNASGSKGIATGVAAGTATITATKGATTATATLSVVSVTPREGLLINEVDYDQPGTDSAEFIEIFNASSAAVDVSGVAVVLINGATSSEYARVMLSGTLGAGGYLLVANPNVPAPGVPRFPIGENGIQNGAPDGIALYDTNAQALLDSLSYEGAITNASINGAPINYNLVNGAPATASDGNVTTGSLARLPNGAFSGSDDSDWHFTATLTPGGPNV